MFALKIGASAAAWSGIIFIVGHIQHYFVTSRPELIHSKVITARSRKVTILAEAT
jgi:hypothetical protein